MPTSAKLSAKDYENLAWVAQGQAFLLQAACAERLIAAGLVLRMDASEVAAASLQLTSEGLALIRSSDQ
ncbi:MAG TPA: hypothetical protein VIM06_05675 [Rhodanobacter sp.]